VDHNVTRNVAGISPEAVLAYLSRCTHRVAISNSRLLSFNEASVTFRYNDYRRNGAERQRVMTLGTDEFIRRFLLHLLPRGFHRIRHYGLISASTRKASLARARELLAVAPLANDDLLEQPIDVHTLCPCCGGHMIIIETFARWSQPRAPPHRSSPTGRTARDPARTAPHSGRGNRASVDDSACAQCHQLRSDG
jgi:hypothetical protein